MLILLPFAAVAVCATFFVYAKTHPSFANRWSRMTLAKCERCGAEHEWRESGLCSVCEFGDAAEINGYD